VDLFFVLSGFVVAAAYEARLSEGLSLLQFLTIRLARLYPLYILGTLISVLGLIISFMRHHGLTDFHAAFWKAVPFAVIMLPSPSFGVMGNVYPLNFPAWSLFFEIIINVVYAATIRFWSFWSIGICCGISALIMICYPVVQQGGWNHDNFLYGFVRVLYSFPMGVLIYRLSHKIPTPQFLHSWQCIVVFIIANYIPTPVGSLGLILLIYPLLVGVASTVEPPKNVNRVFSTLGEGSYPIYALHAPLLGAIMASFSAFSLTFNPGFCGTAFLLILFTLSFLVLIKFDRPVRAVFSRLRTH
jgi:peptidoglycan/LPS O-acetylase OafA/YrhL